MLDCHPEGERRRWGYTEEVEELGWSQYEREGEEEAQKLKWSQIYEEEEEEEEEAQ